MSHTYTEPDYSVNVPFIPHPSWAYWFEDEFYIHAGNTLYLKIEFYHVEVAFRSDAENAICKNLVRLIEISKSGAWYDSNRW